MEERDKAGYIRRIRKEYPDAYDTMTWLSPQAAEAAEQVRQDLIGDIFDRPGSPAGWELAALELIRYALDRDIPLAVNYCSFFKEAEPCPQKHPDPV